MVSGYVSRRRLSLMTRLLISVVVRTGLPTTYLASLSFSTASSQCHTQMDVRAPVRTGIARNVNWGRLASLSFLFSSPFRPVFVFYLPFLPSLFLFSFFFPFISLFRSKTP